MLSVVLLLLSLVTPTPQYVLVLELSLNLGYHLFPLAVVVLHEAAYLRVGRV